MFCLPIAAICSSAACCCAGGVCKLCCWSFRVGSSTATRLVYSVGLIFTAILAWVLRNWGDVIFPSKWQTYCQGECFSVLAVYRVSFGFLLYHLGMCIFTIGVTTSRFPRAMFHNGFWPIKAILLAGLITAAFFIPENFYRYYAYICIGLGIIFLLVQTIIVIDTAHTLAEKLVGYYEETQDICWQLALYSLVIIALGTLIGGSTMLYIYFGSGPGCGLNIFFITFNLVVCIVLMLCSVLTVVQEANPRMGILQPSIIAMYLTYVVASAMASQPDDSTCMAGSGSMGVWGEVLMYFGFISTFVFLGVAAFSYGSRDEPFSASVGSASGSDDEDEEIEGTKYHYYLFHLVFVLAAGYMAVLLTNWSILVPSTGNGSSAVGSLAVGSLFGSSEGVSAAASAAGLALGRRLTALAALVRRSDLAMMLLPKPVALTVSALGSLSGSEAGILAADSSTYFDVDQGIGSMWAKMATSWLISLLFGWTLFAPVMFPDRFSDL